MDDTNEDNAGLDGAKHSAVDQETHKKSETIEIRLPHADKKAFVEACKNNGKTISGTLREAIAFYLQHGHFAFPKSGVPTGRADRNRSLKMMLVGFVVGGLTVVGAFIGADKSLMDHGPFVGSYFAKLDSDEDGQVSLPEYIGTMKKASSAHLFLPRASVGSYYLHDAAVMYQKETQPDGSTILIPQNFDAACLNAINDIAIAQHTIEHALLDVDNDRKLSVQEFSQSKLIPDIERVSAEHNLFDKDGDMSVSFEELQFAFNTETSTLNESDYSFQQTVKLPAACHIMLGQNAALSLRNSYELGYGSRRGTGDVERLFESLDSDQNNRITLQEFIHRILAKI